MKYHFFAALLLCSMAVAAQRSELIKGSWKFKDFADKGKLDSATLKQATIMFSNWEITFAPNGQYFYHSTVMGTWLLNKEETKVVVTMTPNPGRPDDKGRTVEWEIKNITATELQLNMGKVVLIQEKVVARPAPSSPAVASAASPYEVVKFVQNGSLTDLLAYSKKYGITYTNTLKDGNTEYKAAGPVTEGGAETIVDSKADGLVVVYKFKTREHKTECIRKLKEEGFTGTESTGASFTFVKANVQIWIPVVGDTWIISHRK